MIWLEIFRENDDWLIQQKQIYNRDTRKNKLHSSTDEYRMNGMPTQRLQTEVVDEWENENRQLRSPSAAPSLERHEWAESQKY